MKRLLSIILLVSYSIASFGLSIDFDYCCGELEGISISAQHSQDEDCAAQSDDDGCCANTHLDVKKIEDKQMASEQIKLSFSAAAFVSTLAPQPFFLRSISPAKNISKAAIYVEPPSASLLSRQVLFCVFRV